MSTTKQADGGVSITLYDICPEARAQGAQNAEITGVTDNTRELKEGNLFVCIKGGRFDGHNAAEQMLEKGAAAVIAERDLGLNAQVILPDTRKAYGRICSRFYGEPDKKLGLIGVTGTNGKTTTVAMIKHIMTHAGIKAGSIGTAGIDTCGNVYRSQKGIPTTPTPQVLYQRLSEMVSNGAEYCVMEASSQALAQHRLGDSRFIAAAFTNLTQDHLDYHGDMESYFAAKSILFTRADNSVICTDDDYGKRLRDTCSGKVTTVGFDKDNDISAQLIRTGSDGSRFVLTLKTEQRAYPTYLPVIGRYNIQNALCAVGIALAIGIDAGECVEALGTFSGADGRLSVLYRGDFTVISDYAHTDDALDKMLCAVRESTRGRVITVFGAAGDRDGTKRPLMGAAAQRHSDYMIVTSDNPAHEDMMSIIESVASGITDKSAYTAEPDRKKAIELALSMAQKGDVVVLAGKGSEDYQIVGDEYLPFSEKEIVKSILQGKGKQLI